MTEKQPDLPKQILKYTKKAFNTIKRTIRKDECIFMNKIEAIFEVMESNILNYYFNLPQEYTYESGYQKGYEDCKKEMEVKLRKEIRKTGDIMNLRKSLLSPTDTK